MERPWSDKEVEKLRYLVQEHWTAGMLARCFVRSEEEVKHKILELDIKEPEKPLHPLPSMFSVLRNKPRKYPR
ncbi:MAG TPA: hypothetical protein VJW76_16875 [Verrucomicrobiae bacterium]|nr:hypothetical protein [Verrucomicrobiae bacterium]